MELNFRGGHYSCVTVIICGFNFHALASAAENNYPLVTAKSDLCTSHVDQVLHIHLTVATLEMETRLQSNIGGSCRRRTRVQAREKQLSRSLCLGIVKDEMVVSHVPRKISRMCSMFLRCGRSISIQVT